MIAGQPLVKQGILDDQQFARLRDAVASGRRLDQVIVELGFVSEENALAAVGEALGVETIDLANTEIDRSLLENFPIKLIHQHRIFPVAWKDDSLVVATGDPYDLQALDAVSAATGWSVTPVLAPPAELAKLINGS
jgi:hypothetical protein